MLNHYEGILPNVQLDACTREQLQAAHPSRFFPCTDSASASGASKQQLQQEQPDAERIAGLQQGTSAWHQARSCHVTGSQLADLLGFSCPAANRALCKHQVYHRVSGAHAGYHKLLHCIGSLRGDESSSACGSGGKAPTMEPFGQLACTWGSEHEAAAHHTLLQHAPPGSLLIDTGFVSPTFEADAPFYDSILPATPSNTAIGSLGDIPLDAVKQLRLGCSLDGLLLTPKPPGTTSSGPCSSHQACSGAAVVPPHPSSIRRAPPYKWANDAGYSVSCVEIKCPTPYWSVKDHPWAFACVGQDRNKPYLRMRAGHYCQSQLSMLVTGTECCVYAVWTRGRTWIVHVPINRAWLHTCLHLLVQLHQRFVAPEAFTPPPTNLFWDAALLQDTNTQLSNIYRRFIEATAVLSASISSRDLPDPLARPAWGLRPAHQHQHYQQQGQQTTPQPAQQQQQQQADGGVLHALEHLHMASAPQQHTAAPAATTPAGADANASLSSQGAATLGGLEPHAGAAESPAAPPVSTPPPGWCRNSSGKPPAHWVLLTGRQAGDGGGGGGGDATTTRGECSTATAAATPDSAVMAPGSAAATQTSTGGAEAGAGAAAAVPVVAGQPSAAAALGHGWCPVYTCMVKSAGLPLALQQPLQQDRWFLDRLDPDSSSQPQLGAHQAWLDHPLLDPLCDHPAGVQVLLQRVHISQPPLMLWTQAAAAAGGAASQGTAGAVHPAAAAGSGGLNVRSASMAARGLSPGKLVLALLLKMEKLNSLDLSPIWKLLPPSALDVLAAWSAAAHSRASTAAHTAAAAAVAKTSCAAHKPAAAAVVPAHVLPAASTPTAVAAGTPAEAASLGSQKLQGPNSSQQPAPGARTPSTCQSSTAAGARATAAAPDSTAAAAAMSSCSTAAGSSRSEQAASPADVVAARNGAAAAGAAAGVKAASLSKYNPSSRLQGRPLPALASWRQRQHIRQQQLLAGIRCCLHRADAQPPIMPVFKKVHAKAGASKGGTGSSCSGRKTGVSNGSSSRTSRLVNNLRGLQLADLLPGPTGQPAVLGGACAAAADAVGASAVLTHRSPAVVAAAAAVVTLPGSPPPQRQGLDSDTPTHHQDATQPQSQQAVVQPPSRRRHSSRAVRQQRAQRLVSAAQQQQRAARLARYQAAFRAWPLAEMLEQVCDLQVVQQPMQRPVHEVLQEILSAQEQAAELQRQAEQQLQQQQPLVVGGLRPVRPRRTTKQGQQQPQQRQQHGDEEQQQQEQQPQQQQQQQQPPLRKTAPKKPKQQRKPRQPSAAGQGSAAQLPQPCTEGGASGVPGGAFAAGCRVVAASCSDVTAAAAAGGSGRHKGSRCSDLAAFTVVGPAAVVACMAARQQQ